MIAVWSDSRPGNSEQLVKRVQLILIAILVVACLLLAGGAAPATATPFRIGALTNSWGSTPSVAGLRDGLVALGRRENQDFVIGNRFTSGDISAMPTAARELLQIGVNVILAVGLNAALAAQGATREVPIVFTLVDDPVRARLVSSFSRPGGNVTGVVDSNTLLAPKRLEVFKKMIPGLSKVLFIYDGGNPDSVGRATAYRGAGKRLGIRLVERAVSTEAQAAAVLTGVVKGDVDGILGPVNPDLNIPGLALKTAQTKGIPTMFAGAFWIEQGALASYAPGYYASGRQAARLVNKIMRGTKPADIPVEVNNDIEFAVNLKIAKALGLKIDPQVLYQADRIVR